jgi:hypothetical protein
LNEASGIRTANLNKLDKALKSIQPTSTFNERTFSVAGIFSTKLRNSMKFRFKWVSILGKLFFRKLIICNKMGFNKTNQKNYGFLKNKNENLITKQKWLSIISTCLTR